MSLAMDFDSEIKSIETRFSGGLSNTSTKKFDLLADTVEKITGVPKDQTYITAAASRASNLWNRLAQGKPLTSHYKLALGIIGEEDIKSGLSPAARFIGDGNGRYDAICLATKKDNTWIIAAMIGQRCDDIVESIRQVYPDMEAEILDSREDHVDSSYTDEQFLQEVYISKEKLLMLKQILLKKKNLIIQGAPGVGKSFSAKRLAYAIMEERDDSRILNVQFHQSYSYEDFIMGYKPKDGGFEVEPGPFFQLCEQAKDKEEAYFVIIDEINRGNMSRIFGELLMLIENDKRGEKLQLLYQKDGEEFFVPDNVYIIGMMNTADRSLAVIDYALRRRFAFVDFEPAYDTEGFKAYQEKFHGTKLNDLILVIKELNEDIASDEALGEGFRIGHSYFCNLDTASKSELLAIVEYEVIPLIQEYWFDDKRKADNWSNRLRGVLND